MSLAHTSKDLYNLGLEIHAIYFVSSNGLCHATLQLNKLKTNHRVTKKNMFPNSVPALAKLE